MSRNFKIKTTIEAKDNASRVVGRIQSNLMKMTSKAAMGMRRLNRVNSQVTAGVTRGLTVGATAFTGAAIGLYSAVNSVADSMDKLAKKSRAINFPIEEYQEWSFVAAQSGLDTAKFDKGLNTFTKRIGKLRGEFGPLYSALKKTNKPLAKQLQATTDSAAAMDIMIEAIQKAKTSADKSMLADAAFGVTNFALVAGNTTDQLAALRKEMRENGVVSAAQAQKAEAYNDMMNRLKLTGTGLVVDVLTPMMPIMTDLADKARKWAVENRGIIGAEFKRNLSWTIENFDLIVKRIKQVGIGIGIFYSLSAGVKALTVSMNLLNLATKINMAPIKKFGAYMGSDIPTQIEKGTAAAHNLSKGVAAIGAAFVAWEVGTSVGDYIHRNVVEPFMKAGHQLHMLKWEIEDTRSRGIENLNSARLTDEITKVKKAAALDKKVRKPMDMLGLSMGGAGMGMVALHQYRQQAARDKDTANYTRDLETERAHKQYLEGFKNYTPAINFYGQSSAHRDSVEITIKDDTGKATVTKSSSNGSVKLKRTGTMP